MLVRNVDAMESLMDLESIRKHWQEWAKQYGENLRATTKTPTAKVMELDALSRSLRNIEKSVGEKLNIMEVGCGNGKNCFGLLEQHPQATFLGVDFVEEMVESANLTKRELGVLDNQLSFRVGDILDLSFDLGVFDIIMTDRCLINLNTDALQQKAITSLVNFLKPGGWLLMIENSQQTYNAQNQVRELVGLQKRSPAQFNHFFDEDIILPFLSTVGLELVEIEDFISLHDIVLYLLVPMINGGEIDYDSPLVEAVTKLNIAVSKLMPNGVGRLGQNRLYKCRKVVGL